MLPRHIALDTIDGRLPPHVPPVEQRGASTGAADPFAGPPPGLPGGVEDCERRRIAVAAVKQQKRAQGFEVLRTT